MPSAKEVRKTGEALKASIAANKSGEPDGALIADLAIGLCVNLARLADLAEQRRAREEAGRS